MRSRPSPPSRQHGLATLAVALIMLFMMSLLVFNTSSGMLLELKTGNNHYFQAKALEAARGGVEYGISWLNTASNSVTSWTADATGPSGNNQKATLSLANPQTIGGHSVTISMWRNSATPSIIEVQAIATETSNGDATATVREKIYLNRVQFNRVSIPPLVINGCLSGVTGNPDMHPVNNGDVVIQSSQATSCLDNGHLGLNGGVMQQTAFSSSAWDYVFSTSKADMKALADGVNILYYDSSNPYSGNWHDDLGTSTSPAILIFDTGAGCPKINGNVTIWGIVYYAAECGSNQGWGNTTLHGSIVSEGSISKLSANTDFYPWSGATTSSNYQVVNVAKVVASWRDF